MGDTGEVFNAFTEMSREKRLKEEPRRFDFATNEISKVWRQYHLDGSKIIIKFTDGTITFYPFTGWFQGQKPYGKIKGRGIKNLIKELRKIVGDL